MSDRPNDNSDAVREMHKRAIYGGDYAVLWEKADNSGADYTLEITTEQDW